MSRRFQELSLILSFLLAIVASAFGSSFKAAGRYAVGNRPVAIVAGDFNGDGRLDLAVANSADKTVSVLLGNGDGTFAKATDFELGVVPTQLVATDLNGDGRMDLVVAGGTRVSVLLGRGDGGFEPHIEMEARRLPAELIARLEPQRTHQSGTQTASVVFADFNGDGQIDQAVAMAGRNLVNVLLHVPAEAETGTNLIENGNFASGVLSPWAEGRDLCSGRCLNWQTSTIDPRGSHYEAEDMGNIELRQNFTATDVSSISVAALWARHPAGAINIAIDFFYADGTDDEYIVFTSDDDWDLLNMTSYLAPGESLNGMSVWGYGTGSETGYTFVDDISVLANE